MIGAVHHLSYLDLAARLTEAGQRVDALIVDAPYSARTHAGHDDGVASAPRMRDFSARPGGSAKDRVYAMRKALAGESHRRGIDYAPWSSDNVEAFVDAWTPLVTDWIVSITDHVLAQTWCAELKGAGLYTFAPIPLVETGSRVRLTGDGPSSWTCRAVVARPRDGEWLAAWRKGRRSHGESCSLPGAYIQPSEEKSVVGGKPLASMRALVRDYSRPGDLICDPCAGAGTTLVAAKMSGRRFIGSDIDAAHVAIAQRRLDETVPCDARGTPIGGAMGKSLALFGGG